MADDWDSPSVGNGYTDQYIDNGRTFSKGRGFTKLDGSGPARNGNKDDWEGGDTKPKDMYEAGGDDDDRFAYLGESNGNDNSNGGGWGGGGGGDSWGGGGGGYDGGDRRGGGRGGRRGRGGGRGGGRSFGDDDNNDGDFGNRRGGRGGGRGGRGGRGEWNNDDDDDSGNRRGGRGGGRGRGRGGRDGVSGGDGDGGPQDEVKRENYVPPEPTNDVTEIFSSGITSGINFDKYDNIPLEVTGDDIVPAITSFSDAGLRPILLENIKKSGYTRPTPIQKAAIPNIIEGRDIMACAQTGSGKTAAFLVPIIHNLISEGAEIIREGETTMPQVIIVSPTRELAIQIGAEARKFAHGSSIKSFVAYGGTHVRHQIDQIMKGCNILVATPGRMLDFLRKQRISFTSLRFVVLDEADRMLDMGFLPNIEEMMNNETMVETGNRQTLMFSATFPEEIQRLASRFLKNYLFITVGIVGSACSDVQQVFHEVAKFDKRKKLSSILEEGSERTLVFVETKRNADFIASYLLEHNYSTTSIHGDRLQREREEALHTFKSGTHDILVATDVAARGLDIKNVKHVINFDLPKSIDEYVHRIGRTGRVGNRGKATSFFDGSFDSPLAADLVRILKQANQEVPEWLELSSSGVRGNYSSGRFGGRDVRKDDFAQATDFNLASEEPIEDW